MKLIKFKSTFQILTFQFLTLLILALILSPNEQIKAKNKQINDKQTNLKASRKDVLIKNINDTLAKYNATVGISVIELETDDTLTINNHIKFPMQSVYKFPLALTILNKIDKGELKLNQEVSLKKYLISKFNYGKLKSEIDKRVISNNEFKISVDSLIMFMTVYSDNLACDGLFNFIGGTSKANNFIYKSGFPNIQLIYTELEKAESAPNMFYNSAIPSEMSLLLKSFFECKIVGKESRDYLLNYMINDSTSSKRLRGLLPNTKIAHKTGTGYSTDTNIEACNDVGIVYMPNGKHLAISVFVMNSKETYENTEHIIASIAKMVYDYYENK